MNTEQTNPVQSVTYIPVVAAVLILSVVLFLIDLRLWAQPQTVIVPVPTPTIIVITQPAPVNVESQLASLRNQVAGNLPTLDQFRSELAIQPAPPVAAANEAGPTPTPFVEHTWQAPDGATFSVAAFVDNEGMKHMELNGGWMACSDIVAGAIPHWSEYAIDAQAALVSFCMGA